MRQATTRAAEKLLQIFPQCAMMNLPNKIEYFSDNRCVFLSPLVKIQTLFHMLLSENVKDFVWRQSELCFSCATSVAHFFIIGGVFMRSTFKKGLSVLLALVLLFGSVAIGGDGLAESVASLFPSFSMKATALESTGNATFDAFINDSRFTHGAAYNGSRRPYLVSIDFFGCAAYCADFVKYCFNKPNPKSGEYFTGATNIRAGDVIVVGNGSDGSGHWFVCLKRSGNNLYVAEGNYANKVRIGWNYTIVNDSTISGSNLSFTNGWHYQAGDTTSPTISNVSVSNVTTTGYTVTCTVSDNVGVVRVAFPTWTINAGQDDLIWKDGSLSGSTASFRVNISDHGNEHGDYITHIYAYDAVGNNVSASAGTVYVGDTAPAASLSSTNNAAASQTATLTLTDDLGLTGYYWGTSSTYTNNAYYSVSGTSAAVTKTVSAAGTYYLTAKDSGGHVSSTVSATFYQTTLNANDGLVSPSSVITMSGNSLKTPTPTREGYLFAGWCAANGATAPTTVTQSQTLTAKWATYKIEYYANGGRFGSFLSLKTTITDYDPTAITTTEPNRTNSSYKFVGWALSDNATADEVIYQPGNPYTTGESITLYAVWTSRNSYKVTFDANGGECSPGSKWVTVDEEQTYGTLPTPTRDGYEFVGWFTADDTQITEETVVSIVDDHTLTAKWAAYKIFYDCNGGGFSMSTFLMRIFYGDKTKTEYEPSGIVETVPKRKSCTFAGWALTPDATEDDVIYQPGNLYTAGETVSLYAVWLPEVYEIEYLANAGQFKEPDPTEVYESFDSNRILQKKLAYQDMTISSVVPKRLGYRFVRWENDSYRISLKNDMDPNYSPGEVYDGNYSMTLIPVWEEVGICSYHIEVYRLDYQSGEYVRYAVQTRQETVGEWVDVNTWMDCPVNQMLGVTQGYAADDLTLKLYLDERMDFNSHAQIAEQNGVKYFAGLTCNLSKSGFESAFIDNSSGAALQFMDTAIENGGSIGTGAMFYAYSKVNSERLSPTYTVVLFGDVNGDSWYDGTDAYLVNLVANGMVSADNLTEAQRAAADCNHDGNIDNADVALLEQAGLLLANVDQTMPQEELQTDSVYLEYCSLIDQSITITEPEQPAADQPAQTAAQPAASSVWGWIKALFTIVLNWLLRVF